MSTMKVAIRGKVPQNQLPISRTGFTLASLNLPAEDFRGRIRGDIIPPITVRYNFRTGNQVLWIVSDQQVGYMYGTILTSPARKIRVFCQDGNIRTFEEQKILTDPRLLDNSTIIGTPQMLLDVTTPGINYLAKDKVYANIHSNPEAAEVLFADNQKNIALVQLASGRKVNMPYSYMVLQGKGFAIPQVEADYNVVRAIS